MWMGLKMTKAVISMLAVFMYSSATMVMGNGIPMVHCEVLRRHSRSVLINLFFTMKCSTL